MKAKGIALNGTDDCFAQFDAAFAKLEADLATPRDAGAAPRADLSEYEDAFDDIDRQLAAAPEGTAPASSSMPAAADPPHAPAVPGPLLQAAAITQPTITASAAAASEGHGDPTTDQPRAARTPLALVTSSATALVEPQRSALTPVDEALWERPSGGGTPLERLVGTMQNLLWLQRAILSRSNRIADRVRWERVAEIFNEVRQLCTEFELPTARVRAEFALKALDEDRLDVLAVEIGELVRHIRHDLHACSIAPIARERVWGFTLALDERAQKAFPSAAAEVAEAGRCIGFGMHAAAAFHLLRAAECGRRVLARVVRFDDQDPEAGDWSSTVAALQARMMDLGGWPAGPARKSVKDFLTALISDMREMEEARRRLAEGEPFEDCHATALWYATRDFLALGAERVSEARDTLLSPDDFIPRP